MDLHDFFKGNIAFMPAAGLQELLRAILIRSQFNPGVRYAMGWRGLKQCSAGVEGWTVKVKGWAGVFAIFFQDWEKTAGWFTGRFGLCYFPDPEEELVECCSLHGAALCQRPDYWAHLRDFLQYPELIDIFGVGHLFVSVPPAQSSLRLRLEGFSMQRITCRDGVRLERDGQVVELVAPGGREKDFPAFAVASGLFDLLAASVSYILGQPPSALIFSRSPGWEMVISQAGVDRVAATDIWCGHLELGYGADAGGEACLPPGGSSPLRWQAPQQVPKEFADKPWWTSHQTKNINALDKGSLGIDDRPPLILLTGFLGSGKTSFLRHFIEYQSQRSHFVAIIQNEIGAIGLDGKLVDYTVTEIDEGCVCCNLSGSLNKAVRGMLAEFQPDAVIVETTGLANPLNLLEDMAGLDELVRFDCTLTMVDALNMEQTLATHALAVDQIRAADFLLLNKKDLVTAEHLDRMHERIRTINGRAPIFFTVNGDINPTYFLQAEEASTNNCWPGSPFRHLAHAGDGFWSKSLRMVRPIERAHFLQAIAELPPTLFRVKGVVEFTDFPRPLLFQYVAGRYEISVLPCAPPKERFLTLIGQGGDPDQTISRLASLVSP